MLHTSARKPTNKQPQPTTTHGPTKPTYAPKRSAPKPRQISTISSNHFTQAPQPSTFLPQSTSLLPHIPQLTALSNTPSSPPIHHQSTLDYSTSLTPVAPVQFVQFIPHHHSVPLHHQFAPYPFAHQPPPPQHSSFATSHPFSAQTKRPFSTKPSHLTTQQRLPLHKTPTNTSSLLQTPRMTFTTSSASGTSTTTTTSDLIFSETPKKRPSSADPASATNSAHENQINPNTVEQEGQEGDVSTSKSSPSMTDDADEAISPSHINQKLSPPAETLEFSSNLPFFGSHREISALLTAGNRSAVYQWLSSRENRLKVDLNRRDGFGSTLLGQAIRRHYYACVLTLLPFCDTNFSTAQGPPIFHSLSLADLYITRALLDFGANPNSRNPTSQTPLMIASSIDNTSFIQYLLFKGAQVDLQDDKGRTALMYASKKCSPQIARYLHACGADVDLKDHAGKTAIDYALSRNDRDGNYISWLLQRPPKEQRILPDPEFIEGNLKIYRETSQYPLPVDFKPVAHKFRVLVNKHGRESVVVDPNGDFYLKPEIAAAEERKKHLTKGGNFVADNNDERIPEIVDDNAPRPRNSAVHSVFEDVLDRNDFVSRPIEHVDRRYLDWYEQCRKIHLDDELQRAAFVEEYFERNGPDAQ